MIYQEHVNHVHHCNPVNMSEALKQAEGNTYVRLDWT